MSRLHDAFAAAKAEGRAALIAYLPAGFPDVEQGYDLVRAVVEGGADIVEVGWPYSDPLMDGPVIQSAVELALERGAKLDDVLNTVAVAGDAGAVPLVMTYWNPVERVGVREFAKRLAAAGGVGVITPDLTPDEADEWLAASDAEGVDRIFLVAPSSTAERISLVSAATTGFVYAASLMGVTGTRSSVSSAAEALVERKAELEAGSPERAVQAVRQLAADLRAATVRRP